MKELKRSVYLTCTKNRSHQRKHIEVCQRCPANHECRPFQEYATQEFTDPIQIAPPTRDYDPRLLVIVEQLKEIRGLLPTVNQLYSETDHSDPRNWHQKDELLGFLKEELKEIRSLC